MKISELVNKNLVEVNLKSRTKESVILEIVDCLYRNKKIKDKKAILEDLLGREKRGSTGIGDGIAIPHARIFELKEPVLFVGLSRRGIDFSSLDGKPVYIIVLFLTPLLESELHLKILSKVAQLLDNKLFVKRLLECSSNDELYRVLKQNGIEKESFPALSKEEIYLELASGDSGISEISAQKRLEVYGPNRLKKARQTPPFIKFLKNFISFFAILLWIGGGLCFIPGVNMPQLGWAIFCVILVNAVFSFWQEFKAEKAIEAIQRLLPLKSIVLRNGQKTEVLSSELVPGDIVFLEEGTAISADIRLVESQAMRVDNSVLTGESRATYKVSEPLEDRSDFLWIELPNLVFAGTSVAAGSGKGIVIGTGMHTEIGNIARMTQSVKEELSPLQKEMQQVVNIITCISVGLGILFFSLGKMFGGLSFIGAFIFTIGIIVANIPEGLMPTLSLALAMGVQRMSKRNVLVRQLSSIETLGCTNVICTDKTGTLTTNQIIASKVFINQSPVTITGTSYKPEGDFLDESGKRIDPSELEENLTWKMFFNSSVLCNNARLIPPCTEADYWRIMGDTTEGALLVLAQKAGINTESLQEVYQRIGHLPFESIRKRMSTVNQGKDGKRFAFTKGAPLETLARCDSILINGKKTALTPGLRQEIVSQNDVFANEGLRVLAVAYRDDREISELSDYTNESVEKSLTFLALTGMVDPPRQEVPEALKKCRNAGIRTIMITGDYGLTARSVAHKIGLIDKPEAVTVITGQELSNMDEQRLRSLLKEPVIFARTTPEQKMRIISCLKEEGYVVAVTGDGVNDAPAMKKADIGIALGHRANDVAKEASKMIVLDGNFASIVAGIEEGRAIYANIKKFITYVLASNVPELVPFILFVMFKIPLPLTVMQILAIDLGTDIAPALALGAETPESGIMDRPPRPRKERLIDLKLFLRSYGFLGIIEAVLCMLGYYFIYWTHGWRWGEPLASSGAVYVTATTMCLAGIVSVQVGNVFCCRTDRESVFKVGLFSNKLVLLGILCELSLIFLVVYTAFFQNVFGTAPLGLKDWILLLTFGPVILFLEEGRKWLLRRFGSRRVNRETVCLRD